MSDQNPSYAEVVKDTATRNAAAGWPGDPQPDTPTGAKHVNPALNPAPEWKTQPERVVVPVVNDPGVVGAGPDLGMLNRAYREADLEREGVKGVKLDDTKGSEGNAAAIKAAAQARRDAREKRAQEVATKAASTDATKSAAKT